MEKINIYFNSCFLGEIENGGVEEVLNRAKEFLPKDVDFEKYIFIPNKFIRFIEHAT